MLAFRSASLRSVGPSLRCVPRSRHRAIIAHKHCSHRYYSEAAKPVEDGHEAAQNLTEEVSSTAPVGSTSSTSTQNIFEGATEGDKNGGSLFNDQNRVSIAPKSKGWPSPWINKFTFTTFMEPLYAHGWGIRFLPRTQNEPRTICVSGLYRLKGWYDSMKFLDDMRTLFKKEKHHPVSFTIRNHPEHVDITILIQTHSAYRPAHLVYLADDPAQKDDLKLPGVTMRDVRLAALIHELWRTEHSPHAKRLKKLQANSSEPATPNTKQSEAAAPAASKEPEPSKEKIESIFNAKSKQGPWTPTSMRPTWGQLEYAMVRCDGIIPKSIHDWAIGEAKPREQRFLAQPKYEEQPLFS